MVGVKTEISLKKGNTERTIGVRPSEQGQSKYDLLIATAVPSL